MAGAVTTAPAPASGDAAASSAAEDSSIETVGSAAGRVHWKLRPRRETYFVSPIADFALIGGASVVIYLLLLATDGGPWSDASMASLAATLVWAVNHPHFAATSYRLYRSRGTTRQFPITAWVTPVLMVGAVIGSFMSPDTIAPGLIKLYLLWSPYHFSAQTIGIASLYARRSGRTFDRVERITMMTFTYLLFAWPNARAEVGAGPRTYYGVTYQSLDVPQWFPDLLRALLFVAGAIFAIRCIRRMVSERELIPLIVLTPIVTQAVWFIAPPTGGYRTFVPLFHSLQYLAIAWAVQVQEAVHERQRRPGPRTVALETIRWMVMIFVGGLVLFWVFPRFGRLAGVSAAFATGVVFAVVQLHHFFVDGVIWKLRGTTATSPLSGSVREIWRS